MKQTLLGRLFLGAALFVVVFFASTAIAASPGNIDPNNVGDYKAAFLDNTVVSDTAINFGKFTTESQYDIAVSDASLRGYAWGSSVGWIVTNCLDTTSGCSSTNGNFAVANDGTGKLSGYAWGENTGWINFGPFTDTSISTVKIDGTTGNFEGTLGSAGYAWSQNYGWIVFDCTNANTCVNTSWRPASSGNTGGGGTGGGTGGTTTGGTPSTPTGPTISVQASNVVCDNDTHLPHWGANGAPAITAATAATYVANSNGHCQLTAGQQYQWGAPGSVYNPQVVYGPLSSFVTFGPTDNTGSVTTQIPLTAGVTQYPVRTVLQTQDIPFTYSAFNDNRHPVSAEFYCSNDGINYDDIDYIINPTAGSVYHCVSFNTTSTGAPVTTAPGSPVTITASAIFCDSNSAMPHWGSGGAVGGPTITATTAATYVANSNGHCHFDPGVSFQWGDHTAVYPNGIIYGPAAAPYTAFGPTGNTGSVTIQVPFTGGSDYHMREILQSPYDPFSYEVYANSAHAVGAEFYCATDVHNYDDFDWILSPQAGGSYYCIGFNQTGSLAATTTTPPISPTNPNNPPTNPGNPITPTNPTNPTTPPTTPTTPTNPGNGNNPGTGTNPGNGGGSGNNPGSGGTGGPSNPGNGSGPGNGSTASGPTTPPTGTTTEPPNNPAQSTDEPGPFAGGITLPPALTETITNMISSFSGVGSAIAQLITNTATALADLAHTSTGAAVATVATALGVVSTAAAGFATLLVANPLALAELALLPFRLWTLVLIFFGYKKRQYPWGTVYDSVTKQPIDPAYVMLTDLQGNEIATAITDIDGRYGFSVPAGTYRIMANKTNYEFPSKKLFGRTADELYDNLYFGDVVVVKEEGEVIIKNIPMDRLNFDWNEFAKNKQKRMSYYRRNEVMIIRISNFFFWLGAILATISVLSSHTLYNDIVFLIYILLLIVQQTSRTFKPKGTVSDAVTGSSLSFAIVHVLSKTTGQEVIHKVADRLGNYYCLVPNGTYQIIIDRKNDDGSYTKIPISEPVHVRRGYLKKEFKV